ncbi:MAG: YdcF family protein [Syntrophothermus sp.]
MPTAKKYNSGKSYALAFSIAAAFANLFFLYFLKYKNQNLSLSNFNLFNTGNIFNGVFTFLLIIALVIYSIRIKKVNNVLLYTYSLLLIFFLLIAASLNYINIGFSNIYYFAHPIREVLVGFFFSAYLFTQTFFMMILWLLAFREKRIVTIKAFISTVIIISLVFIFAFLKTYLHPEYVPDKSEENNNIGVVLGAAVWKKNSPSPSLASRVDKAYELYNKGYIDKIQLTGGNAPGELSEAETAYRYLLTKNLNMKNVLVEKKTTSTNEQVEYIKKNLMPDYDEIVIISDSYHLPRISEICKFYDIKTEMAASNLELSFEKRITYKLRESVGLIIFWFFAL